MSFISYEKKILGEIIQVLEKNPESSEKLFLEKIILAKKVFVAGGGRSGLIGKSFAMRLMQAGKNVFVVGETITPSINKGDLLICVSSSGKTRTVLDFAVEAKNANANVVCITSDYKSNLAKLSDFVVLLKISKTSFQPLEVFLSRVHLFFLKQL